MSNFDQRLGDKIRVLRLSRRMSQEQLACLLDVSTQQAQKYEKGDNRISPERLQICADYFGVPVGYFFDDQKEACAPITLLTAVRMDALPSPAVRAAVRHLVWTLYDDLVSRPHPNHGFIKSVKKPPQDAGIEAIAGVVMGEDTP